MTESIRNESASRYNESVEFNPLDAASNDPKISANSQWISVAVAVAAIALIIIAAIALILKVAIPIAAALLPVGGVILVIGLIFYASTKCCGWNWARPFFTALYDRGLPRFSFLPNFPAASSNRSTRNDGPGTQTSWGSSIPVYTGKSHRDNRTSSGSQFQTSWGSSIPVPTGSSAASYSSSSYSSMYAPNANQGNNGNKGNNNLYNNQSAYGSNMPPILNNVPSGKRTNAQPTHSSPITTNMNRGNNYADQGGYGVPMPKQPNPGPTYTPPSSVTYYPVNNPPVGNNSPVVTPAKKGNTYENQSSWGSGKKN